MKHAMLPLALAGLAACAAPIVSQPSGGLHGANAVAPSCPVAVTVAPEPPSTGLATLSFRDPLSCRMNFSTGDGGGVIQDHMVKNNQGDIDFGHDNPDCFTVGIEGGKQGSLVDLGTLGHLEEGSGFTETVGGDQGFASIRRRHGELVILEDDEERSTQPLRGVQAVLDLVGERDVSRVVDDLVRLVDRHDPEFELFAKFHEIAYEPGVSVTIRWVRLEG